MTESTTNNFGRVTEDGTVYVTDNGVERVVGQYAAGTPEEALAFYARKYDGLVASVTLLEARVRRDSASIDISAQVEALSAQLVEPAAVGDIQALRDRVEKLKGEAAELSEEHKKQREEAKQAAIAERDRIATEAEKLAAQPVANIQWKQTSEKFEELFNAWQENQKTGFRLPKAVADEYWKRFRNARQKFETERRRFFTERDQQNKEVKQRKEKLIASAEKLADKGAEGISQYRNLLDEWKSAGRASRKIDDALWERFKAAGDALYEDKAKQQAVIDEEYKGNLEKKEALIVEIETILEVADHKQARNKLTEYQLQWAEIGRVPREAIRSIEDRLRKVENHVTKLEEDHWRETNPETKARSEGLRGQLEDSIAQLETEIANTKDAKTKKELQEKLKTQQSWLAVVGE